MYKTYEEVTKALTDRTGVTKLMAAVDKGRKGTFSYVPWNETVHLLDRVFGPFGWSAKIVGTHNDSERGIYRTDLDLEVRCVDNDRLFIVSRPGTGVGTVAKTQLESPDAHDTAIKGSRSDAISVAAKALGDAFGLFLYDKGDPARTQNAPTTTATLPDTTEQWKPSERRWSTSTAHGDDTVRNQDGSIGVASPKQVPIMLNKGYTERQIAQMDKPTLRAVMDFCFDKTATAPMLPASQAAKPATSGNKAVDELFAN